MGVPFTIRATYTVLDSGTMRQTFQITNTTGTSDLITGITINTLGLSTPAISNSFSCVSSNLGPPCSYADINNIVVYSNYGSGQWAVWDNAPSAPGGIKDHEFSNACTIAVGSCVGGITGSLTLAGGQTATFSYTLRFTADPALSINKLAPEAFSAYRAAFPDLVKHPDRRPISAWFMSDNGHKCATNPRGWFNMNSPCLDVFAGRNYNAFQSVVGGQADTIVADMLSRPVQPQGIVLWDMQGQEFKQPESYIGDPRVGTYGYAPEMFMALPQTGAGPCTIGQSCGTCATSSMSALDIAVCKFKTAGYAVGTTLRPQHLEFVPSLPSTCSYNSNADFIEYLILTGGIYANAGYRCQADGTWSSPSPQGNGGQTSFQTNDIASVVAELGAKVAYAHTKWGMTLFYADSTVWSGGSPMQAEVWRQMQTLWPDCIFMPEEAPIGAYGAAIPYNDPGGAFSSKITPALNRYAYPNGNLAFAINSCLSATTGCFYPSQSIFEAGQQIGDIQIINILPQTGSTNMAIFESMVLAARSGSAAVEVQDPDSRTLYRFSGSPATVQGKYPVKMRVYFAPNAYGLPTSAVYCENGQIDGGGMCLLSLAEMTVSQIRYYDFSGNLVSSEGIADLVPSKLQDIR